MTNELIFDAFGDIDDVYVLEAKALFDGKPKIKMWKKFAVAAACFALVFAATLPILQSVFHNPNNCKCHSEITVVNAPELGNYPYIPEHISVSKDNVIVINTATVSDLSTYQVCTQTEYNNLSDNTEKFAFIKEFENQTGLNCNEFVSRLSVVYPTKLYASHSTGRTGHTTYTFTSDMGTDEDAIIRVCKKGVSFSDHMDIHPDETIFSVICGTDVLIVNNFRYGFIAEFEHNEASYRVIADTDDISKFELLISAILTPPEAE